MLQDKDERREQAQKCANRRAGGQVGLVHSKLNNQLEVGKVMKQLAWCNSSGKPPGEIYQRSTSTFLMSYTKPGAPSHANIILMSKTTSNEVNYWPGKKKRGLAGSVMQEGWVKRVRLRTKDQLSWEGPEW